MSDMPAWLPPLVLLGDYGGHWDSYLDAIYAFFKRDFIDSKPMFHGRRLGLKRFPMAHGKEATFWHMTSEGLVEEERTPDLRRCERIRWPKPLIEHTDDTSVKYWVTVKRNEDRIHIWLEDLDYVVVLADRKDYLLPWTAFLVTQNHTKGKLRKEHESYWRSRPQKG